MSKNHDATTHADQAPIYEIRLKGHLGREWAEWFCGMAVDLTEDGNTLLTGAVGIISLLPGLTDLVALFGLSQLAW